MKKRVHIVFLFVVVLIVLVGGILEQCPGGVCGASTSVNGATSWSATGDSGGGESAWTTSQWDIDKDDNPENGEEPAKRDPNNWLRASQEQIRSLTAERINSAPKEIIEQISDKLDKNQWDSYLQDKYNGVRAGEGIEGARLEGDIISKNGAEINLRNIPEGLNVGFEQYNSQTYGVVKDSLGNTLAASTPARVEQLPEPVEAPGGHAGAHGGSGGGGGGGDGGEGGGDGGGGDLGQRLQAGLSLVQQLVGLFKELTPQSNGQGETRATANPDGSATFELDNGAQVYLEDEEKEKKVKLAQNEEDEKAVITVDEGLNKLEAETNTKAVVYDQVDIYTTPETPPTEIVLDGINGDSPQQLAEASALSQEYSDTQTSPITVAAISPITSEQYVKLIQHDIIISGEKILVDIFKSFNQITAKGTDLWIKNGDIDIKFHNKKIYYPRKIKNSPYTIGKIANQADTENYFKLTNYKDNKGRLIDVKRTVSVGDLAIEHPREKGLLIARNREDMWVER